MAGNIIPAIATTNAVISGLIVLQALQLLKQTYSKLRNVHLQFKPSVPLSTIRLSPPNPECGICRDCYATLQCDTTRTLLGDVVQGILGNDQREVSVYEDKRVLSDPDWVDNFDRTLESLGVTKGKFLSIVDEDGDWSTISLALSDLPWVNFYNTHRIYIEVVSLFGLPSVSIIHTLTYYLHHSPNQPVKSNSRLFQKLHKRLELNDLYRWKLKTVCLISHRHPRKSKWVPRACRNLKMDVVPLRRGVLRNRDWWLWMVLVICWNVNPSMELCQSWMLLSSMTDWWIPLLFSFFIISN